MDWCVDLYRFEYLAEVFLVTFGMPILTLKVYGFTKFEIDIFNVLIAQRALFHSYIHLHFIKIVSTLCARILARLLPRLVVFVKKKNQKSDFFLYLGETKKYSPCSL